METPSSSMLEGYITRRKLAKELAKSVRTLDRWHAQRIGPPRVLIGRTVLYRRGSVLRWLSEQERENRASPDDREPDGGQKELKD